MNKRRGLHALIALGGLFWAQTSGATTIMDTNWREKNAPTSDLQAHDFTLLGDSINLSTGGIQFDTVDVSLPGNSHLPVEFRRRLNPSRMQGRDFGDWYVAIPTISTKILTNEWYANTRWGKLRCSGSLVSAIPNAQWPTLYGGAPLTPDQYSDGVNLDVPGRTSGALLNVTGGTSGWPIQAKKGTVDNWYFTCLSNIDGNGTEGFVAVAPNGDQYTFNVVMNVNAPQSEFDIWEGSFVTGSQTFTWQKMGAYYDTLAVSQVTDVNGNWVHYIYNASNQLISIQSNDGRQIDIGRTGGVISTVTVPATTTSSARQWTYTLSSVLVSSYGPPAQPNGTVSSIKQDYWISLTGVTLPDGRAWQYNLSGLNAKGVPGSGGYSTNVCKQFSQVVSVTHPDGVTGVFNLDEVSLKIGQGDSNSNGANCPNTSYGSNGSLWSDVMAVTKKTLSGPGMPSSVWTYSYGGTITEIITSVVQPDNTRKVVHHPVPYTWISPSPNAQLSKEELFATPTETAAVQVTDYTYEFDTCAGGSFLYWPANESFCPFHTLETTVTRGADWYKTHNTFNTTRANANYSYGSPVQIDRWSSLGGGTRTTTISYANNLSSWILGLKDTVTKNGKPFDHFGYDTQGRITSQDRFGVRVGNYTYFLTGDQAGLINTYSDGLGSTTTTPVLGRTTTFAGWYRGTPGTVTRPDATILRRTVDSNGWVKSITDWIGNTTSYLYNSVGWLTSITRPSPWSATTVGYSMSTGRQVQTSSRGTEQDTTTYDGMLRPTQKVRAALSAGGGSIYTSVTFDAMGRKSFVSLPAATAGTTYGTSTTYEALGRVQTTTNTATGAVTRYDYLASNKTKVTDPMSNVTTTTYSGYGTPDDGNDIQIDQPEGISTKKTYDIYGNQIGLAQLKADGTYLNSAMYYDSSLRLCRKSVPESGDTLYLYDSAGEMTSYTEGQASGSVCPTAPTAASVLLSYDVDGRLTTTTYPNCTPSILRTYDNNDNLLTINREGANWAYTYNTVDLPVTETLSINGRTYGLTNNYDVDEKLTQKTFPSGTAYTYTNNGLGQVTAIQGNGQYYVNNTTWSPNGKIRLLTQGNGNVFDQQLDNAQRVNYIDSTYGDKLSYGFDLDDRITQITAVNNTAYNRNPIVYDGVGRLWKVTGPWGLGTMKYDPLGNILSKALGSRTVTINYDAATNRVSQVQDTAISTAWRSYSYDARGNTTSDGLHGFTHDDSDQPIAMTGTGGGRYRYDGNLRRVKEVVGGVSVYSIYDRSGALITRDNTTAGTKTDYLSVGGQTFVRVTNGVATYPINDHLGTAYMVAAQNGTVSASNTYNYNPWGEAIAGSGSGHLSEQGFTGHIEDPSGLTYMQARYYDPAIGRFLEADPIGYKGGLNLYTYVGNDPLDRTDPSGRLSQDFVDFSAGVGDVALAVVSLGLWDGPEIRRVLMDDAGSVNTNSSAYKNGFLTGVLGTAGLGEIAASGRSEAAAAAPKTVVIDSAKYPESAAHAAAAQAAGKPSVLTVDRAGAAARRSDAMQGTKPTPGKDRDEYPPAMFKEGGKGASVQPINPGDNRGAGASMGHQCSSVSDGDKVRVVCK
jgi:RHS repeat-associated protein